MSTPPPSASIPTTTPRSPSANRAKTVYLIGYNFVSAVLWLAVLGRVALITPLAGTQVVYRGTGDFAKWTQTLAGLEVLHSVFGEWRCFYFAREERKERESASGA